MILRLPLFASSLLYSVDRLKLAICLPSVVSQQSQHRLDTLAALRTATTGRIYLAGSLTADGRRRLLQLSIGQRVAQADIHGLDTLS